VFKLGIGNDLEVFYKLFGFEVERSKIKVNVRVKVNSSTTLV